MVMKRNVEKGETVPTFLGPVKPRFYPLGNSIACPSAVA